MSSEKFYTLAEAAERLQISIETARQLFMDEPGVLKLQAKSRTTGKMRFTYRIPESVLERVIRRFSNPAVEQKTQTARVA